MDNMFYDASPEIFRKAEILRNNPTKAERLLWEKLKNKQLGGSKFRRQHPIANFIVDLYCHKVRLVIEIDGTIHDKDDQKAYDKGRTLELTVLGLMVIRFRNEEIFRDINSVIARIKEFC